MRILLFFLLLFSTLYFKAQTIGSHTSPFQNQVILQHYPIQELQSIQQTDTAKFNSICYYYTRSYVFEIVPCPNCNSMVLPQNFDVSQYEYLRQKNKRTVRHFEKYGFKLTLLSVNELQYKLPVHLVN